MNQVDDERFMALALVLARRGLGQVWPNPAVGCVIVRDGRIVGRGWTAPGGRPHAETRALDQAGDAARGATAYVTLEPCAHHGRTPPCAEALLSRGISSVVTALTDPDPRVAGRGHAILRRAGVQLRTGVGANAAEFLQLGFLKRVTAGRPMVTLKLATSLDGRIATASGESRWITGPAARRLVHAMRASHDAVLVGAGTARADDPALTVRDLGAVRQPVRVVLAKDLDLPREGRLATGEGAGPLWLLHGPGVPETARSFWSGRGAEMIEVSSDDAGRPKPDAALAALGDRGLTRVFCEGGGGLAASLLKADLVDRLAVFGAGLVLGGDGLPATGPLGLNRLAEARRFDLVDVREVGADVVHQWGRAGR